MALTRLTAPCAETATEARSGVDGATEGGKGTGDIIGAGVLEAKIIGQPAGSANK